MDNIKELKFRELSYRYEVQKRVNGDYQDLESGPFFFTDYTGLKGCGCKISREKLNEFLKTTQYDWKEGAQVGSDGSVGIGLDSAIVPLKAAPNLRMVQSTDFFYPIVDDPFVMGLITVSNVLSDLYATGVYEIDNMLMLLGVARDLIGDLRLEVVSKFMAGFH
uniref:Uncharacterized protein n=1 Tax=Panagrolaimus sp. PS1159 TaxID=55785 RepID=A0AC35FCG6_9BILA